MRLYKKEVLKSVIKGAVTGYQVGSQFETTNISVTHTYANNYKVSSYTTNDGCLFAVIFMAIRYLIWGSFCSYVAPFLIFKKYKANKEAVACFEAR